MMKKILFIATVVLLIITSCDPYHFYDDYDWYFDRGPSYLAHYISTNGEMFYVRTYKCPTITYDAYSRMYYCWDGDYLILRSDRPITVHHIHNGYR